MLVSDEPASTDEPDSCNATDHSMEPAMSLLGLGTCHILDELVEPLVSLTNPLSLRCH